MNKVKIIVATHKKYKMPDDELYLPVQVGSEGKENLGYQVDNNGENISYIENLYDHYNHTMYVETLDETRKIIEEKCPNYLPEFDKLHKRTSAHMFNMFVMKKEYLNDYCEWLFDILFELEKRIDSSKYDSFHARYLGRISELLLDVWINTNGLNYMQNVNWFKKGCAFLMAKFAGKKYKGSF